MAKEEPTTTPSASPPKEVIVKKPKKKKANAKSKARTIGKDELLQKKIKKEAIKRLLKDELKKEMRPLVVGSVAMLLSTASNQGMMMILTHYDDLISFHLMHTCIYSLIFLHQPILFVYCFCCCCCCCCCCPFPYNNDNSCTTSFG